MMRPATAETAWLTRERAPIYQLWRGAPAPAGEGRRSIVVCSVPNIASNARRRKIVVVHIARIVLATPYGVLWPAELGLAQTIRSWSVPRSLLLPPAFSDSLMQPTFISGIQWGPRAPLIPYADTLLGGPAQPTCRVERSRRAA
eukprot:scaffold203949_cov26-Tisochrysis_lutea.AAC.2